MQAASSIANHLGASKLPPKINPPKPIQANNSIFMPNTTQKVAEVEVQEEVEEEEKEEKVAGRFRPSVL